MHRRFGGFAIAVMVMPLLVVAQNRRPSFEAASIKPNKSGCCSTMLWPLGRFTATSVTVSDLLVFAYSPSNGPTLQKERILGGPSWMDSDRFDVQAKPEKGENKEAMQIMMQSLLEDRFGLRLHMESREMPVYNLVVVKGGLKMKQSNTDGTQSGGQRDRIPPGSYGMSSDSSGATLRAAAVPVSVLVGMLSTQAGRLVIDKTDLNGLFDFRLEFSPASLDVNAPQSQQQTRPSLFAALQEQLGLKLEAEVQGDVFVIDHVEKPSEN